MGVWDLRRSRISPTQGTGTSKQIHLSLTCVTQSCSQVWTPSTEALGLMSLVCGCQIFFSSFMNYKNLFRCPRGPLLDEQRCEIDSSVLGANYTRDQTGTQYFIKHESGRVFERQTTMFESEFHNYKLRRVVDESGQIDKENFEMLMEKLDGQDLVVYRPASP